MPGDGFPQHPGWMTTDRLFAAAINQPTWRFAMTPLRQRMLEELVIRNIAENTPQSYRQKGRIAASKMLLVLTCCLT